MDWDDVVDTDGSDDEVSDHSDISDISDISDLSEIISLFPRDRTQTTQTHSMLIDTDDGPPPSSSPTNDDDDNDGWLTDQLQASVFYVEPVRHITYQLLFVSFDGKLERSETRVMRLSEPNVIDRFDIGRIIKMARTSPSSRGDACPLRSASNPHRAMGVRGATSAPRASATHRLDSLFVYNVHVTLKQLPQYIHNPAGFDFVTALTSINNFTIKPTLACFHSLNSVHIVLRRLNMTRLVYHVIKSKTASTTRRRHRR
jgi:hypothetical protein